VSCSGVSGWFSHNICISLIGVVSKLIVRHSPATAADVDYGGVRTAE